jgi:uncharacterized protein with GYD domain
MATYVLLLNWTDHGAQDVRNSPALAEPILQRIAELGGDVREALWTQGPYDLVVLLDAPDEEVAAAVALYLGATGRDRVITMRAFNAEAMSRILARLGPDPAP